MTASGFCTSCCQHVVFEVEERLEAKLNAYTVYRCRCRSCGASQRKTVTFEGRAQ
jgi:hypothetical protein